MAEATKKPLVLGIRREDKNRWERRAPLAPSHVQELVKKGVKVIIQPSSLRTFSDRHYAEAGAIVQDDLSEASTIICVKEVPSDLLIPNKTYLFFSHTIKAQRVNMPMLDTILEKNIRLIDYETITDSQGKRLVRFGKFAGYAGTIDTLHALGDRLLALGHSTPFLHLGYSYCYSSLDSAKQAVKAMGEEIEHYGLPSELVPMVFCFTSQGNVSQGSQEIFQLLPHKWVTQKEMEELVKHKEKASPFLVYGVMVASEDHIVPNDPKATYNKSDYYSHPEKYHSAFNEKFAPYVSVIMNCTYWDHRFPRMLTIKQMQELVETGNTRLLAVGDISCDRMGSLEFLLKTTSIDQPLFVYDPKTVECKDSTTHNDYIYAPGILFCAVDNFPTEFPKEATHYFGDNLLPFLESILRSDLNKPFEQQQTELPSEISKAVITSQGKLTPRYQYISELRKETGKSVHYVLVLGAGFVSGSCVDYLSRQPNYMITIADINLKAAQELASKKKNCTAAVLDATNEKSLDSLVQSNDIVISLLPATLNVVIAKSCLRQKKHLVTASYTSPQMKELHAEVEKSGLVFLNEMGLDPGIDHLEAKRVIAEVHEKGGKVVSFVSWCGGLPMPEASGNPLAYKFSWSPRGVLTAATKDAKYLQEGKIVNVPGMQLFKHKQKVNLFPGFNLEGIPNRDSTVYAELYGIKDEVQTMFRGTLRYTNWCDNMEAIVDIGMLDETHVPWLAPDAPPISWNQAIRKLLKIRDNVSTRAAIRSRFRAEQGFPFKGFDDDRIRQILDCFEWLELFNDTKMVVKRGSYIDCFCELLQEKLKYEKDEHDMVLLHHIFGIEWPDGRKEHRWSSLVVHGNKHGMAMNRSVGLPVAIATELIVGGAIKERGVVGPMESELYKPLLKILANEGLKFVEKSFTPSDN